MTPQSAPSDSNGETQETISANDAAWILSNTFRILTMQTGFCMLEAGHVSSKNIVNIMFKNIMDVTIGGLTYWMFGFALSFGVPSTSFFGYGDFFFSSDGSESPGSSSAKFFFHFCFAAGATTIVSGAVAERMKLSAYIAFSAASTFIYCVGANWAWNKNKGFLHVLGYYDFAGGGVVHMIGGCSALIGAILVGPRMGRFAKEGSQNRDTTEFIMSSPVTALTGTFMLWWAWLSFNCGSTFGVQRHLWRVATKAAVNTVMGSIGGSMAGLMLSYLIHRKHL
ncbi:MAG: hypothetical protein GY696_36220 [Gammaproteobacteria bacterium]|nr:hypothetical protein [Gammaproteobacteria bacterium]